jgi:hypothetical protein
MTTNNYRLYCEVCSYCKIIDSNDIAEFIERKRLSVGGRIPKFDPFTRKVEAGKPKLLPKQFKCPKCGRLITPKKIITKNDKNNDPGCEDGSQESIF